MADEPVVTPPTPAPPPPPIPPAPPAGERPNPPPPKIRKRNWLGLSLVWLVPIIAAIAGISVGVHSYLGRGTEISITFLTADGLQPGRTEVRYKDVTVGHLRTVSVSSDRSHVIAKVDMDRNAERFAVADTSFWVVKPRLSASGVTGLNTLLSGAYISLDAGTSQQPKRDFTGLEVPPLLLHGESGKSFTLQANDLGSLDFGSPVFYRGVRAGRVVGYKLNDNGKGVAVQIFVDQPYMGLVTTNTHFWNASGVDLSLDANGLKVRTQSLATIILGGITFGWVDDTSAAPPAAVGAVFQLFQDQATAMAKPDTDSLNIVMHFDESVRGLAVGAPIDFLGVTLGTVTAITLDYDKAKSRFPASVTATIHPSRLGPAYDKLSASLAQADGSGPRAFLDALVSSGVRAQLRTANLLTGQEYVALDFVPKVAAVRLDPKSDPAEVPTVPGTLQQLQPQVLDIVAKLHDIPFDQIGRNLRDSLGAIRDLIHTLSPEAQKSLKKVQDTLDQVDRNLLAEDAPAQQNLNAALEELRRAAQSTRALTDYLERHPEAVIRGKSGAGK